MLQSSVTEFTALSLSSCFSGDNNSLFSSSKMNLAVVLVSSIKLLLSSVTSHRP